MSKIVTVAIAGLGNRGKDSYAKGAILYPNKMKIVALAEPDPDKLADAAHTYHVPQEMCFASAEDLLKQEKLADVLLIATQDRQHVSQAIPALKKGYDLLMEKPISPVLAECRKIVETARECGREVVVCHVLRYAPFFRRLKEILDSGIIGDVVELDACEHVGYFHMAHSFVRGNWRNSHETSPMILQKCCHDMDLYLWLTGKHCSAVSSFGSINFYKEENAPAGSALRCADCKEAKESCIFDADKIYLSNPQIGIDHGNTDWPCNVLTTAPTPESVRQALKTGPYGRCVFHCDNNVVDHQVVNLLMTDGSTMNFSLSGFAVERSERYGKFMGTKGIIDANLVENTIAVSIFGKNGKEIIHVEVEDTLGHGGGDEKLLEEFLDMVITGKKSSNITSVAQSVESHYIALAAEESRLHGGQVIDLDTYRI